MQPVTLRRGSDADLPAQVADDIRRVAVSAATDVVPLDEVEELRSLMDRAVAEDAAWLPEDRYETEYGRVLFLPRYGTRFLDLLSSERLMAPIDHILGPQSIVYTMTSSCKAPHSHGRPLHTDTVVIVPEVTIGLGLLVLLDDFTADAGPTRFYPTITPVEPTAEQFEEHGLVLEAPAGSACWFHGGAWHDAPANRSDRWRRAVLVAVTRPEIRQRFDMVRMMSDVDLDALPDPVRQKLGLDLLPPGSYEEYYLPDGVRQASMLDGARRRSAASPGDQAGASPSSA